MKRSAGLWLCVWTACSLGAAEGTSEWKQLFNGKDLSGWDKYLAPKHGGREPLGLNNDPLGVFEVVQEENTQAIRVSGEIFGAITTHEEFGNVHIRVEYKWGAKKWPPRAEPKHYRDSGILYWCVGEHGAGSRAWMRSVECNIMEKGVGQWWAVAGTYIDIEGKKVVLQDDPRVPYRGESRGEQCLVYTPGGPHLTTGEGVTSLLDPEKAGDWNVCEVIAWGNVCVHILNGEVVLVLTNPRFKDGGREVALTHGKIQLQSEGAELYYRKVEVRPLEEIPKQYLSQVPVSSPDEKGFVALLGKDANDGWAQCGPGHFTVENGVATGDGGMGLWWHTNRTFTNFVIRGEFNQEQEIADSGIFVRFPNPGQDPWLAVRQGHEFEIGDPKPKQPKDGTGAIYPFKGPVEVPMRSYGEWNQYEITCIDHNYSFRLNGKLITTWTDPKRRSMAGFIGLQNYNDGKTVRHRNLRIKDLPATPP
jgi:hypothetical protein